MNNQNQTPKASPAVSLVVLLLVLAYIFWPMHQEVKFESVGIDGTKTTTVCDTHMGMGSVKTKCSTTR